jgi:hypothetical protein
VKRRQFLGAAALAASGAAACPVRAAVSRKTLWVYDPAALGAVGAADLFPPGAQRVAIAGDRIRLARDLLAREPQEIRGVTRYADYLVLSGAAAELGYRVVSRAALNGNALSWAVRRSR